MSVEELKELERGSEAGGSKLAAAASSYCWLIARAPRPARRAARIVGGGHREGGEDEGRVRSSSSHPRRRFSSISALSCQKDPNLWVPCCGGPTATKPPEARTAEEAAAAADAYEASRTGEEREAFGVALSSMQIWYVHRCSRPSSRARCRRVMRASPDMRR